MNNASAEMMGNEAGMGGEFQLVELEQRLEMAAVPGANKVIVDYCCRCVLNPLCDMN